MLGESFTPARMAVTPAYVLAVIREEYRQQLAYDPEAEPDIDLSFNTTVDTWRNAQDLVSWRKLGKALNSMWNMQAAPSAWHAVLEPAHQRTLGEVCAFIARHAPSRPILTPARLCGTQCLTAGTFFILRNWLAQAGADVRDLRPSTPLAFYLDKYPEIFLDKLVHLAPGEPPLIQLYTPLIQRRSAIFMLIVFLISSFMLVIAEWSDKPILTLAGAAGMAIFFIGISLLGRIFPSVLYFEGIHTFRDLITDLTTRNSADAQ